jgi:hypothetical protein
LREGEGGWGNEDKERGSGGRKSMREKNEERKGGENDGRERVRMTKRMKEIL